MSDKPISGMTPSSSFIAGTLFETAVPDAKSATGYTTYNISKETLLRDSQTLTDAATITMDASLGLKATVTLAGDRTQAFPTNLNTNDRFSIRYIQDATGSRNITLASGFICPSGAPVLNPVAGSYVILTFQAVDSSNAILMSAVSSQQNWRTFTGANNTVGTLQGILGNATGGSSVSAIPSTNNTLIIWQSVSTAIFGLIVTLDGSGNVTNCPASATTIMLTALNTAATPLVCMMPDGLNAVISYGALRSAVYCQNLITVGISGLVITPGTEAQVRATEAITANFHGAVCALTNSGFSLVFRTTTANILYAYQMSFAAGVITTGSTPLTIETGNAVGGGARQVTRTSTTTRLVFNSKVTATTDFVYAVVLTFNGINNLPTMGALFRFLAIPLSTPARNCRVDNLPGSTTKFIITAVLGSVFYCQVIDDASGVLSGAGASFTMTVNSSGSAFLATFLPDANTLFVYFGNSQAANAGLVILNISPAYAITVQNAWYSLGVAATASFSPDFTAVPIGSNAQVGFLLFASVNTGNILTTVSVRP